jgi:hypothetical protein
MITETICSSEIDPRSNKLWSYEYVFKVNGRTILTLKAPRLLLAIINTFRKPE